MDAKWKNPPRVFEVDQPASVSEPLYLKDFGNVTLGADEQLTFVTEAGGEYDIARKSWGYYATPSLNSRLPRFQLRAALIKDENGKYVIVLVEQGKHAEFEEYIRIEAYTIVCWLDSADSLELLESKLT